MQSSIAEANSLVEETRTDSGGGLTVDMQIDALVVGKVLKPLEFEGKVTLPSGFV